METASDSQKEAARRQVEALEAVQPADLGAGEIGVRIGANWVPIDIYQQFMVELLTPGYYAQNRIKILRSEVTGQWAITEKNSDRGNVKVLTTYGTKRMSAYHILEQTLNQKDVRVFYYIEDENGNKKLSSTRRKPPLPRTGRNSSSRNSRSGYGGTLTAENACATSTTKPSTASVPVNMTDGIFALRG